MNIDPKDLIEIWKTKTQPDSKRVCQYNGYIEMDLYSDSGRCKQITGIVIWNSNDGEYCFHTAELTGLEKKPIASTALLDPEMAHIAKDQIKFQFGINKVYGILLDRKSIISHTPH